MIRTIAIAALLALAAAPAAAQMRAHGMASTTIGVKDEARSIAFYSLLGLKKGRLHHPGQQEMRWETPGDGPSLVLNSNAEAHKRMVPGSYFFVMFVPNVAATVKALRDAGFAVTGDIRTTTYDVIIVNDPDGNPVELIGPASKK